MKTLMRGKGCVIDKAESGGGKGGKRNPSPSLNPSHNTVARDALLNVPACCVGVGMPLGVVSVCFFRAWCIFLSHRSLTRI